MGIVNGLILIVLGVLCVPALIAKKSPKAKGLLDKLAPFQGIAGVAACVWGVAALIRCVIALRLLGLGIRGVVSWVTMLAVAALFLCAGALLGWTLIRKHLVEKTPDNVKAKAEGAFAKLSAVQSTIGIAAIAFGAWAVISGIVFSGIGGGIGARSSSSIEKEIREGAGEGEIIEEGGGWDPDPRWMMDRNCFAAGITILMADGSLKNIELVQAGDRVRTWDFETGQLIVSEVSALVCVPHDNLIKLDFASSGAISGGQWQAFAASRTLTNSSEIVTTGDHPFWIERGVWAAVDAKRANTLYYHETPVAELKTGDRVFMPGQNTFAEIISMESVPGVQITYTIELLAHDNFIANGMLVKTEEER